MTHWLDGVARLLMNPELDLIKLAKIAGCSDVKLYEFCDLSKCDLRGQDLRGLSFEGSILDGATMDQRTKIDGKFDPRNIETKIFTIRVNRRLNKLINSQAYAAGYTYAVWFVKWCFEAAYKLKDNKDFIAISADIDELDLVDFYSSQDFRESGLRHINLPIHLRLFAESWPYGVDKHDRASYILLIFFLFRMKSGRGRSNVLRGIEMLLEQDEKIRKDRGYMSEF